MSLDSRELTMSVPTTVIRTVAVHDAFTSELGVPSRTVEWITDGEAEARMEVAEWLFRQAFLCGYINNFYAVRDVGGDGCDWIDLSEDASKM